MYFSLANEEMEITPIESKWLLNIVKKHNFVLIATVAYVLSYGSITFHEFSKIYFFLMRASINEALSRAIVVFGTKLKK